LIPPGVEVFVGLDPIDLRWSFDRLAGLVEEQVGRDVRSGAVFAFRGKRGGSMKLIFFDGSGLCIFYKRLDRRVFRWPCAPAGARSVAIDERTLEALVAGIDVEVATSRASRLRLH